MFRFFERPLSEPDLCRSLIVVEVDALGFLVVRPSMPRMNVLECFAPATGRIFVVKPSYIFNSTPHSHL